MTVGDKIPLLGMTLSELKAVARELGMPDFAARQMADWLYKKRVFSIEEMTNLSAQNRKLLGERYVVGCSAPADMQRSADGTVKYLYRTAAGGYGDCLHSRRRPCDIVRVLSSGVQDGMPFLHDGKARVPRQPDSG